MRNISSWVQKALVIAGLAVSTSAIAAQQSAPVFSFPSIDGGNLNTGDWRGKPVLVINTASMCGFSAQLGKMQKLHDAYKDRGLVVLAVPSDDFNQEKDSGAEVKEFCELTYGVTTVPMTEIVSVKGDKAHPFYKWLKTTHGFSPRWNFYKVLLDGSGQVVDTWSSMTGPDSKSIRKAFEPLLPQ